MNFTSLAGRNLKEVYRDPVTIVLGIGMPIGMLLLFTSIEKRLSFDLYNAQNLTPGIIVFSFAFMIMFSAMLLAKDRQTSFLIRLFTTPLRPSDYILAYTLPFLPLALAQELICLTAGMIMGATFSNIAAAMVFLLFFSTICISIGTILGSLLTVGQVSGLGSVLVTAIGLLCGAWMDVGMIGGFLEKAAVSLPFIHAVEASRKLLSGQDNSRLVSDLAIITAYAVMLFAGAVFAFRKAMKRV
ncbi:MAG: ABC transporter permease [Bacteroidota bacterium]